MTKYPFYEAQARLVEAQMTQAYKTRMAIRGIGHVLISTSSFYGRLSWIR